MTTKPAPLVYSTLETARLLGVHAQTIRGLIRTGKLHGCRVGRNLKVPKTGIEQLLGQRIDDNGV